MTVTPILGLEKADGTDITKEYLKVELAGSLDTLDAAVLNPMTTPGDLIRGGTGGLPTRLGIGTAGQVLAVVGGLLTWVTPAPAAPAAHHATHEPGGSDAVTGYVAHELVNAKGDLLVGFAPDVVGAMPLIGANGWVLTANSVATAGMYWNPPASVAPLAHASTHQPGGSDALTVDAAVGVGSLRTLGTGGLQAAVGSHTHGAAAPASHATTHQPGGADAMAVDAIAATGSLRTLGTGTQQAAVGSHAHAGYVTNPMTTAADLIVGGASGTPTRLGVGGASQVLTVVGGVLAWATPAAGGMANPMTTLGDLIAGGASGAPGRLGVGTEGQVLSVASGAPAWAAPPATDSLLTNGGMEVWSRGNGPFTGVAAYTADRWQLSLVGGSTASVSRDSANADAGSLYCAAVVYTHAAASRLLQVVEPWAQLRWRTVTFAARVRTATASAVRLSVWDSVNGFRYSAYHTGGGAYETLAVTAPIGAGATGVQVSVDLGASCTAYLDDATLVAGSAVLPYVPLHPADEMSRCLRYYEVLGGGDPFESLFIGQATAATNAKVSWAFKAVKAGTPTLAFSAAGDFFVQSAAANLTPTGVTFTQATPRSVLVSFAVASGLAANDAVAVCAANTNCRLVAEANV